MGVQEMRDIAGKVMDKLQTVNMKLDTALQRFDELIAQGGASTEDLEALKSDLQNINTVVDEISKKADLADDGSMSEDPSA